MNYYDQANLYADGYVCSQTVCRSGTECCCGGCCPQTGITGTVIPLFSGTPIALTTTVAGVAGVPALLGTGTSGTTNTPLLNTIDLNGFGSENINFALSMPRAGTITSVSAYFSITQVSATINDTDLILHAEVYQSNALNNIFTAIPETLVTLTPVVPGLATLGTVLHGVTNNISVPVTPQTRLMMVFWAVGSGVAPLNDIRGYASAGINIQ